MNRFVLWVMGCAMLAGCASQLPTPISRFDFETPRSYGYVIGDEIRHRLIVETRRDLRLESASLPKTGAINRWLQLNDVTISSQADGRHWTIELRYQAFYAPADVKTLTIPGFVLQFSQAGQTVEQNVPAWPFTLSPLKALPTRDDSDYFTLRPDAIPTPLSDRQPRALLYVSLTAALLLGGYLAWLYGYFPGWPKRRVFKRLPARLTALSVDEVETALRLLHDALNTLHGRPLFAARLPDLFAERPAYRSAAEPLTWFFRFSDRILFGNQRDISPDDWQQLLALATLCLAIEQGSR